MFTHFSYFFRDVFHKTPGDGASFEALDSTLSALKRESENDHRKSNILQKTYKIFFVIIKRSMDKNGKMRLKVKKTRILIISSFILFVILQYLEKKKIKHFDILNIGFKGFYKMNWNI